MRCQIPSKINFGWNASSVQHDYNVSDLNVKLITCSLNPRYNPIAYNPLPHTYFKYKIGIVTYYICDSVRYDYASFDTHISRSSRL